jgi:hypothetical protein
MIHVQAPYPRLHPLNHHSSFITHHSETGLGHGPTAVAATSFSPRRNHNRLTLVDDHSVPAFSSLSAAEDAIKISGTDPPLTRFPPAYGLNG